MSRARRAGIAAHAQLPAPCLGNYLTPPSGDPPPPHKPLIRRAAHAQWPSRLGELFDAAAPGSRKLPEQIPAGRPDWPSSSPGAVGESLTSGQNDRLRTAGQGSESSGPMARVA